MKTQWMKQPLIAVLTTLWISCQPEQPLRPDLTDQQGYLEVKVCSRGCYQYILKTTGQDTGTWLYPVHLDKDIQQDAFDAAVANRNQSYAGLPVLFSGVLLNDSTVVNTPGANDVPVPAFKARNIQLTRIRKR